jgi:hypothetical protein
VLGHGGENHTGRRQDHRLDAKGIDQDFPAQEKNHKYPDLASHP